MPQSLSQMYLHIVFSTQNRNPLIDEFIEPQLHGFLGGVCRDLECHPLKVGGYIDHVHILCGLSRKIAVMKLLEDVKRRSSKWVKTMGPQFTNFFWQDGYGTFLVSPLQIHEVARYIENQHEHYKIQSFQDECRGFYKRYNIEYDERYVWD